MSSWEWKPNNVVRVEFGAKYRQMSTKELYKEWEQRCMEIEDFEERLGEAWKTMDKLVKDRDLMGEILLAKKLAEDTIE